MIRYILRTTSTDWRVVVHALDIYIYHDLPPEVKAAQGMFNRVINFMNTCPPGSIDRRELQHLWSGIEHPEFIWELVNDLHDRWASTHDLMAQAFLHNSMAILWQHGVRDTTDTLTEPASAFLARLALLSDVHRSLKPELKNELIGPAYMGWVINTHLCESGMDAPLPQGAVSWGSYITGIVMAVRRCRQGEVTVAVRRISEYLSLNGLMPDMLGITHQDLNEWVLQERQLIRAV